MQCNTQEQPLALVAVKSHYPTNWKEEEVKTGELKGGQVDSMKPPLSDQHMGTVDTLERQLLDLMLSL